MCHVTTLDLSRVCIGVPENELLPVSQGDKQGFRGITISPFCHLTVVQFTTNLAGFTEAEPV
jgi:hypothetical protein